MNFNKATRFMLVADVHGVHQDEKAVEAALYFRKVFKPTIRVDMGDLFDLTCLREGANAKEKAASLDVDLEAGMDFFNKFSPTHKLDGNHEDRIPKLLGHPDQLVREAAQGLNDKITEACRDIGCRRYPYDTIKGIVKIGDLNVIHGFGKGGPGMARDMAIEFGPVVCGHGHRIEEFKRANYRNMLVCNMIGCLCNTHMEWDKTRPGTFTQAHGWGYGFVDLHTGKYALFQAKRVQGEWIVPTEFTSL